ncbi:hypothetical protein Hanom_Chr07g00670251 [Helianthus anomalus]
MCFDGLQLGLLTRDHVSGNLMAMLMNSVCDLCVASNIECGNRDLEFMTKLKNIHLEVQYSIELKLKFGATIVVQIVSITPAENYVPKPELQEVSEVDNVVSMAPENSLPKLSKYVTAGAAWLNEVFGKVAKAGQVAGTKTRQK